MSNLKKEFEMKRSSYIAAALAALFTLVSCETENLGGGKKDISLKVTAEVNTKSADEADSYSEAEEITSDGISLYLTTTVCDNLDNEFLSAPRTKGDIITSANFEEKRSSDFNIKITDAGTTSVYYESKAVNTIDDTNWYVTKGSEYAQWPNDESAKLDFWAWSGASACSGITLKDAKTLSFSYAGTAKTAESQSDLIFANTANQSKGSDGSVSIHFYHALAAVQFVVGNLDDGITVNGITLGNVKSTGKCSFVPAGSDVDTKYVWSEQGTPVEYSQTFSDASKNKKSNANYQQCFDGSELKSTFFVVPQSLAEEEGIFLTINVTDSEGRTYDLFHPIKGSAAIAAWKAGKIYRYMISNGEGDSLYNHYLDVEVEETSFDGSTKTGVTAQNTGLLPSYVRAAIVGNWCNDAGKVMKSWNGQITVSDSSDWFEHEGFYYYRNPVPAGTDTKALIETFAKAQAGESPSAEAHFELVIAVQAIEWKSNKSHIGQAWGSSIPSELN